ncbi:unnamed protein product [Rotaria socialis]|uniref:Reverse transcriptase domain-containing protein n=1 Tax=Rotaria socialis TaxID=392032 RepID=A0A820FZU6_9BILA|nr:unnamed protein product [Rotaria socialis]CAF3549993.1 unnamed protein product [Rotaria socialis]CAF4270028.1 unnamed protein product [Rotaria socialis]CAF4420832.1 unnamed protein product [Rotaria socialis]
MTSTIAFIDINIHLNLNGLSMLTNGRKYIIPCQSYFNRQSRNDLAKINYERISNIAKECIGKHQMSVSDERAKLAFRELEQMIQELYTKPLSRKLYRRARHEYRIVKRLQKLIRTQSDIIIRRIDKGEGFYLGRKTTMDMKTQEYMNKTEAYQVITTDQCPLMNILHSVENLLDYLLKNKAITSDRRKKLLPDVNKLELAYLYTLPKIHKAGIPIRPIISGLHALVRCISKFLNDLLAPIYLQVAHETTFTNGIDVIRRLEQYTAKGYLKSTTKLFTADVENLYTMVPREGGITALIEFLNKYTKNGKIGPFTIDMILRMARLILDTNYFVYNDKYYHQKRGGAIGSAFTQVFANIYMLEWEQELIQHQASRNEIYGRYIDVIFMTKNMNIYEITTLLDKVQHKDSNIKITLTTAETVHFLDVAIMNDNGHLRTFIYHKPKRIRIELALLLNQYPPQLISNQFHRFFQMNKADLLIKTFDQQAYNQLHQRLLYSQTKQKSTILPSNIDPIINHPVLEQKLWDKSLMIVRYHFETGPNSTFARQFYAWWEKHYQYPGSPANRIDIRLIPQCNKTLQNYLISKRPNESLLKGMDTPSN